MNISSFLRCIIKEKKNNSLFLYALINSFLFTFPSLAEINGSALIKEIKSALENQPLYTSQLNLPKKEDKFSFEKKLQENDKKNKKEEIKTRLEILKEIKEEQLQNPSESTEEVAKKIAEKFENDPAKKNLFRKALTPSSTPHAREEIKKDPFELLKNLITRYSHYRKKKNTSPSLKKDYPSSSHKMRPPSSSQIKNTFTNEQTHSPSQHPTSPPSLEKNSPEESILKHWADMLFPPKPHLPAKKNHSITSQPMPGKKDKKFTPENKNNPNQNSSKKRTFLKTKIKENEKGK